MKNYRAARWLGGCVAVLLATSGLRLSAADTTNSMDKTYSGTITSVDPQASWLKVKGLIASKKFSLANDCVYLLLDSNLGTSKDLRTGQKVKVDYQETNGVTIASRVELQPQIFEGQVTSMDISNRTLTISVHWLDKTFDVSSNCAVTLHNDKSGSLTDVQIGGRVIVSYETPKGIPTASRIAQKSETYTGTVSSVDVPNRTVKARTFFGSKKFSIADNCAIMLATNTAGKLSDVKVNERALFSYDTIHGVNVANRIAPIPTEMDTNRVTSTYVTQPGTGY